MNISPTRKSLFTKYAGIALVVIFVLALVAFLFWQNTVKAPDNNVIETPQGNFEENDAQSDAENKQDFLDKESDKNSDNQGGNDTDPQSSLPINFSAKTDNETVIITTNLSTITSGECKLTIAGGASNIVKTAPIMYSPEYSSCAGFSVEKSEVNADSWEITLDAISPTETYSKTITYRP